MQVCDGLFFSFSAGACGPHSLHVDSTTYVWQRSGSLVGHRIKHCLSGHIALCSDPLALAMSMPTEGTPPPLNGTPIPVPAYFRHAEPGFSLKRPGGLSRSLPPRPPAKGSIPVSRLFPPRTPGWHQPQPRRVSFLCETSETLQSPGYDPSRPESFFQQNFQRLSRLGHGSYGEVFKVNEGWFPRLLWGASLPWVPFLQWESVLGILLFFFL